MTTTKKGQMLHKKSNVFGRVPSASTLGFGEIAVNYNEKEPFLAIKTSGETNNFEVVKISSDKIIEQKINDAVDKVGSELNELADIVSQNELVTADSLTELNDAINYVGSKFSDYATSADTSSAIKAVSAATSTAIKAVNDKVDAFSDTVVKTTPQTLSEGDKNQVKENLGISTPDWNANEGEDGHIENKPFYKERYPVNVIESTSNMVKMYAWAGDVDYYIESDNYITYSYGTIEEPLPNRGSVKNMDIELGSGAFMGNMKIYFDPDEPSVILIEISSQDVDMTTAVHLLREHLFITKIHRLDEKFISDAIARKSDIIENEEIISSALNSLNTDIKQLYKIIEEGEGGVAIGAVSQVATDLYNFKNEVRTGITVHNSERIAGQTIDEIVSQLAGASGGLNPEYDSDSKAYIVGIDDDSNAYYSDVYMSGNTLNAPNGFFQQSDENLKTFISNIEVDLEKITQLPKKYFMWSDKRDENIHLGTSAQAVQELYPEIVRKDKNGNLTVDYSKLSIIALRAIDVLNEERKQMKADIAEIKNKLGL